MITGKKEKDRSGLVRRIWYLQWDYIRDNDQLSKNEGIMRIEYA